MGFSSVILHFYGLLGNLLNPEEASNETQTACKKRADPRGAERRAGKLGIADFHDMDFIFRSSRSVTVD